MNKAILSIDAGGQSLKYALVSYDSLEIITVDRFFPVSSFGTKEELLDSFRVLFIDAIEQSRTLDREIVLVSFSVPGPFDCKNGVSQMDHKWPELKGVALRNEFRSFGIFDEQVRFIFVHDVHAFLIGETVKGPAKGSSNVVAVIIGTGLGFGVSCSGELLFNENGGVRYSIFKDPYRDGILEEYIAARGITREYEKLTNRVLSAKEIADLAREGDLQAQTVYRQMGSILGTHIAPILKRHSIDAVVIGGRISCAYDLFGDCFKAGADDPALLVYPSFMLEDAAIYGAAAWGKKAANDDLVFQSDCK